MKKIIIITLCILLCFVLTGCTSKTESSSTISHAMIMPDGSIIQSECTAFIHGSTGYTMAKIDGVKYYTNDWRIVIWG